MINVRKDISRPPLTFINHDLVIHSTLSNKIKVTIILNVDLLEGIRKIFLQYSLVNKDQYLTLYILYFEGPWRKRPRVGIIRRATFYFNNVYEKNK